MMAMTLQNRLVAARRQAGLTQLEVAREMGWPQSRVSKIEMGEYRRPRFDDIVRLARLYKQEVAYFALAVQE